MKGACYEQFISWDKHRKTISNTSPFSSMEHKSSRNDTRSSDCLCDTKKKAGTVKQLFLAWAIALEQTEGRKQLSRNS